jgi:hypothetical protein
MEGRKSRRFRNGAFFSLRLAIPDSDETVILRDDRDAMVVQPPGMGFPRTLMTPKGSGNIFQCYRLRRWRDAHYNAAAHFFPSVCWASYYSNLAFE